MCWDACAQAPGCFCGHGPLSFLPHGGRFCTLPSGSLALEFPFCCVVKSAQWAFHPIYCFPARLSTSFFVRVSILLVTWASLSVSLKAFIQNFIYYKSASLWRWFFLTPSPLGHASHFSSLFLGWWLLIVQWPLWVMPVHFWPVLIELLGFCFASNDGEIYSVLGCRVFPSF